MIHQMVRRGPDDEGFWSDEKHCQLGFRRLAILDLSPTGHQPMETLDGRHVLVFNGEVYNFPQLRNDLSQQGVQFRSTGDTEVVLNLIARQGDLGLARLNGMFALAMYDRVEKRLLLARDHAGIKPLYYLLTPRGLVFGSQYDQILSHPWAQTLPVSKEAMALYLRLGYIPAPYALLEKTHMLEPGCWLEISADGKTRNGRFFEFPLFRQPDLFGNDASDAVDEAITRSVRGQMQSDVPLGTFLSGGIDSPLVAAKMQAIAKEPVLAFTIGTQGDSTDESPDAMVYAKELGVDHTVEHTTPEQAFAMLEDVVASCGEPFADYSVFPTMLVSQLARKRVTVMLSGDGGDELFWGYASRFAPVLQWLPELASQPLWMRKLRWWTRRLAGSTNGHSALLHTSVGEWYRDMHARLSERQLGRLFQEVPVWPASMKLYEFQGTQASPTAQWMRWNEFVGHLTMVLLKVDRASMHHSLEVRVPLLDRQVIDVASRVDWTSCLDVQARMGKKLLRDVLRRHVRYQTVAKRGFEAPMGAWLRGPLRSVMEEVLLSQTDLLGLPVKPRALRTFYMEHLSRQRDHTRGLWTLLSLALWQKHHFQRRAGTSANPNMQADGPYQPRVLSGARSFVGV